MRKERKISGIENFDGLVVFVILFFSIVSKTSYFVLL